MIADVDVDAFIVKFIIIVRSDICNEVDYCSYIYYC